MAEMKQTKIMSEQPIRPAITRPAGGATLTPRELWIMMRQHIWLIIIMTVAGFAIGGGSWYLAKRVYPKYTAVTLIEVLAASEKDPTQIGTYPVNRDIQYVYRQSLASILVQQSTFFQLLNREKIRETNWFKALGGGGESTAMSIERGLKNLQRNFVALAERESDFIRVSMTAGEKKEAALIVNEMVTLFLQMRGGEEEGDIRRKLTALDEQKTSVLQEMTTIQQGLSNIRATSGFTDLEKQAFQTYMEIRLSDLEVSNNELTMDIANTAAQIRALDRMATGPITEQIQRIVESDYLISDLVKGRVALETAKAGNLTKFGENHREIKQIQEQINEISAKKTARGTEIGELIRISNLRNGEDALAVLQTQLAELQAQKREAEEKKRQLDLARAQYADSIIKRDEAQKRLEEINVSIEKYNIMLKDPETPKIKKLSDAPEPLDVSFPRWELFFPGGLFLGLLFGIGLAFLIERLNHLVRTGTDVARHLRTSLLGTIPDADEDDFLEGIDPTIAIKEAPYSIVSESYRNFRSNLKLSMPTNTKAILITSSAAGDGKTSVAANLAMSFASQGRKVLLIDANFWRPKLNVIFPVAISEPPAQSEQSVSEENSNEAGENIEIGLSTVLTGLCGYHEVIRPSGFENCDVVDAGLLPPNPAELLGSIQMEQFIKHQCERYEYVVVDGPPVLLVGDVKMLARIVDGTILVVNAANTTKGAATRAVAELNRVGATLLGCVLFGVKAMKGGYFREQFRSYQEYQGLQFAKSAS